MSRESPLEITTDELRRLRESGSQVLIIDVRTLAEFEEAHVVGAVHIPYAELGMHTQELRQADVVVAACAKGGGRSTAAAGLLRELGIVDARVLEGGTLAWLKTEADGRES